MVLSMRVEDHMAEVVEVQIRLQSLVLTVVGSSWFDQGLSAEVDMQPSL